MEDQDEPAAAVVKSEFVENDVGPEIDSIEEIDTGSANEPHIQNVMEEDGIKAEPTPSDDFEFSNKISDGIDHSALEGMVNLCEDR